MKLDIVRAWKDESYRASLSEEQLALLPANPIGEVELSDSDLAGVCGGAAKWTGEYYRYWRHHSRRRRYSYWRRDWDEGDSW